MKMYQLTESQRKFAEEQHSILEKFLQRKRLPFDEYYDVVVFRFLSAVQEFVELEDLSDEDFENLAVRHMQKALDNHFKKQKREQKCWSLDYQIPKSRMTFGDTIVSGHLDVCEQVCRKLSRTNQRYRLLHTYSIAPAVRQECVLEVM